jgi:flagellar assembly protein FliH
MAAPAQKFLFNDDFGAPEKTREKAIAAAELAQAVAAAEQRGYQNGFAAGQNEASVEAQRRSAMALEQVAQAMHVIASGIGGVETRMETEAVEVGLAHQIGAERSSAVVGRLAHGTAISAAATRRRSPIMML